VDGQYGPLDWRLPEAHAIYWAALGLEKAKENPDKVKGDDLITLRRIIYQSMLQVSSFHTTSPSPIGIFCAARFIFSMKKIASPMRRNGFATWAGNIPTNRLLTATPIHFRETSPWINTPSPVCRETSATRRRSARRRRCKACSPVPT
jgi:hypothetical protein